MVQLGASNVGCKRSQCRCFYIILMVKTPICVKNCRTFESYSKINMQYDNDCEIKICCSHSQLVLSQPGYEFLLVKNKNQIPMRLSIG